jgi:Family of unknown function (DUF6353)
MITPSKLKKFIPVPVVRSVSRKVLQFKKNSPHIFFVAGIVGSVGSTVLACRATLKLSETLDDIKKDLVAFEPVTEENIRTKEVQRELGRIYGRGGYRIVKLYTPAALVGIASIGALTGSHIQLARRNTALMAAFAAVHQAFEDYRERVRAEYGEERELELYHDVHKAIVADEDGNPIERYLVDPNKYSPYAKLFDEFSEFWNRDPELNRLYVQCQQNYANNLLHARGHVFLNEVYDMLGIGRTKAGAVVGWVRHSDGDNYVSFGIFEAFNSAFVNGYSQSVLLDFNVDGVIYDKI